MYLQIIKIEDEGPYKIIHCNFLRRINIRAIVTYVTEMIDPRTQDSAEPKFTLEESIAQHDKPKPPGPGPGSGSGRWTHRVDLRHVGLAVKLNTE
jgi:hypothetical protein